MLVTIKKKKKKEDIKLIYHILRYIFKQTDKR